MAIYHFSAQMISRSKGQSAVAAAAYRSGERLKDERTNERKFYKREVKPETMILAPSQAPEWVQDRNRLWNEVEASETRKNSQVAREINIALPRELSKPEQVELIRGYVQKEFIEQGMIADVAIHRDDQENPHAHVMLTTREISEEGFTVKNRDWNKKELLEQWREQWAEHANKALEREGIQDRISHLSHEARGLEVLPTVHLGHVAHEMEKRGIESDRGTINRDREEYNRVVMDLQKYREEKRALEQEITRQQEQKQNKERFYTATERVHLQEAAKLLQTEPTLPNITKKCEQLHQWEKEVHTHTQAIRLKQDTINEVDHHYKWIQTFENQIEQAQQRIDQINWLNPLKVKENRITKEKAIEEITFANNQIQFHDEKLNDYRIQLGFDTKKEFRDIQHLYQTNYPRLLEENRQTLGHIHHERDVLEKAEKAHRSAFVRQVVSSYPERPEMRYISYETAQKIDKLQTLNQNKVVPIEKMEKTLNSRKNEIQRLHGELDRVNQHQSRLQRAERYLKHYEQQHTTVEKIENNPFLKGKILISKSAKQDYEQAITKRDQYHDLMKSEGVSGRTDFQSQTETLKRMETQIPKIENQIQSQQNGLDLLESIIKGIEQATRNMQWDQQRQNRQQQKPKRGKQQWKMDR